MSVIGFGSDKLNVSVMYTQVNGQQCEITWVSNDRQRVRVRFDDTAERKRHTSSLKEQHNWQRFTRSLRLRDFFFYNPPENPPDGPDWARIHGSASAVSSHAAFVTPGQHPSI